MEDGEAGAGLSTAGDATPWEISPTSVRLHQLSSKTTFITFLTSYIFVSIIIIFLRQIKINQVDHT